MCTPAPKSLPNWKRSAASGGRIKFIALVENAVGFFRIEQIAKAHPRVVGLSLGSEDFAADVGMQSERRAVLSKQQAIFAARAAGILPMDSSDRSRISGSGGVSGDRAAVPPVGFMCASAVHPLQVSVLNDEFSPTRRGARAERMIAAYDDAYAAGLGRYSSRAR